MKKKATYRIRNWSQYNSSLKKRGSLKIWISSEAIANWTTDGLTGEPGAKNKVSYLFLPHNAWPLRKRQVIFAFRHQSVADGERALVFGYGS